MKARILAGVALVALLVSLTSCGDDDDGDTATPEATTTTDGPVPSSDTGAAALTGEEGDVAKAWTTVFDSAIPVADKLAYVADPAAAEAVLNAYADVGRQVGGISFAAEAVTITGDAAEITYDVSFAGNPVYQDLKGAVERSGDKWVVSQAQFCEVMSSARTTCP